MELEDHEHHCMTQDGHSSQLVINVTELEIAVVREKAGREFFLLTQTRTMTMMKIGILI